jgi:ABC-type multidrug transport system fused ATPase/permease subunit
LLRLNDDNQLRYVGQEPVLFSGTIFDNISYGLDPLFDEDVKNMLTVIGKKGQTNPGIVNHSNLSERLMERIIHAATTANAHEFISNFPKGHPHFDNEAFCCIY